MAKKRSVKNQPKKPAAKIPEVAATPISLLELTQRVRDLEDHVVALKSVSGGAPPPGMRPLTFTLADGGPKIVRLLLDGHESLILGTGPVKSALRANGVDIEVQMEVWGDPGQRASIEITNGAPTPMVSSELTGSYLKEDQDLESHW